MRSRITPERERIRLIIVGVAIALMFVAVLNRSCHAPTDPRAGGFQALQLTQAKERAQLEEKFVVLEFYADWCSYCRRQREETWPDPEVQAWLTQHAVPIRVDVDQEKQLAREFDVRSLPMTLVLTGSGAEIARLKGFHSAQDFLRRARILSVGQAESVKAE